MKELIISTREYRETLLSDPYRPAFHFAIPDDEGIPGDPNGAFYADGVYHLMYLYKNSKTKGFHWGHISSVDLLHWRNHPDALTVEDGDDGCFSGGAFVDDDGTAYLTFWKFPSAGYKADHGGIAIAYAKPPYEKWERIYPIAIEGSKRSWGLLEWDEDGKKKYIGCADPSNIWKMNGKYYMQTGNKVVLDNYGRNDNAESCYRGDWTELFSSEDLKTWKFVHRFYFNPHNDKNWPDETEDDMCPSFLPLYDEKENGEKTSKWLQLFISHNRGCQYYVGEVNEEVFYPEVHGRMSWADNAYFAPEALIDNKKRQIIWSWLLDNLEDDFHEYGWSGVYGFPRVVWWKNNRLNMAPAAELDSLQYNHQKFTQIRNGKIPVKNGELFRIKAVIDIKNQVKTGLRVRESSDGQTYTEIYYDKEKNVLGMDTTHSGENGWRKKEEAPLSLEEEEKLFLDIFVDKSVVEVYANERQAICRRVYPKNVKDAVGVTFIGSLESIVSMEAWEMVPANPY